MNNKKVDSLRKSFIDSYKDKDFFSSIEILKKIIKLYDDDIENISYLNDLFNLAYLYYKIQKYSMAIKFYKKIIKVLVNREYDISIIHELNKVKMLVDCNNFLGICQAKLDKNNFAIKSFEKALILAKKYLQSDTTTILNIYHNLGCSYFDIGRYDDAIYYHLEELSIRNSKDKNIDFIDNLNFLGYDYEAINDYEMAIGYFNQALEIIKGLEGINSSEYMNNCYYLANVYFKNSDYEKAIKLYKETYNLFESKFGEKSPHISEILNKLSSSYLNLNNFKDAINLQLNSLNIVKQTIGTNHIYYLNNLKKIADIYYYNKDYEKALQFYNEQILLIKDIFGSENDEYTTCILKIINTKLKINDSSYKNEENILLQLFDSNLSDDSLITSLLILSKIYIQHDLFNNLDYIYDFYKKIENISMDDMIEQINQIDYDLDDFNFNVQQYEKNFNDKFDFENFD